MKLRDLCGEHFGRQFVFRHGSQRAARAVVAVEHRDAVALEGEIIGGGKPGGPSAYNGRRLSGGRAAFRAVWRGEPQIVVGHEAFQAANVGGIIGSAAPTALFARVMAEPPQHRGQRERLAHGGDGFAHCAGFDLADHRRDVEPEWAEAFTGREAVAHVVAEEQFQSGAARLVDFLALAFHDHAGRGDGCARGDELAIDFHQADEAGGERPTFLQVAEGRDGDAELPRGLQHGLARLEGDFLSVNGDFDRLHTTSMAL